MAKAWYKIIQFQSKKNRNRNQTQNVMDPNNEDNYNSQETKKERGNRQQEKIHGNKSNSEVGSGLDYGIRLCSFRRSHWCDLESRRI